MTADQPYAFRVRMEMLDRPDIWMEKDFSISLPAPLGLNDHLVFEGDSEFANSSGTQSYPTMIVPYMGGKMRMPLNWNRATGGENTTQMADDAQIAAVNAANPALVVLLAGTNDNKSSDAAAQTVLTNLQKMVDNYTSKFVVICPILPRFASKAETAAAQARIDNIINPGIRAMASAKVKVVDIDSLALTAADFQDGLHPNQYGLYKVGGAIAAAINGLTAAASDPLALYSSSTENVLVARGKDTSFANGGGTVNNTGTGSINTITTASGNTSDGIPAGWVVTNPTSLALTVERVSRGDGTFGCRIRADGNAAAAGRIQLRTTITRAAPPAAGQTNEQWCGYDQAANMQGVSVLDILSTSSLDFTPGRSIDSYYATGPGLPAVTNGVLRTAQFGVYAAGASSSFTQYIEIFVQPGAVKFDVTFYKPFARLVTP